MSKLKPLRVIKESYDYNYRDYILGAISNNKHTRKYMNDSYDKHYGTDIEKDTKNGVKSSYDNPSRAKEDVLSTIKYSTRPNISDDLKNDYIRKRIKLDKDVINHMNARDNISTHPILGHLKMGANNLGEKITDHSDLADQASHHIGNDGVGYATAGVGLATLGGAIHLARKKLRSNKPVHESDDPNKWQRRAAKVVKYSLGAAAVGGGIQALAGGGVLATPHDAWNHAIHDPDVRQSIANNPDLAIAAQHKNALGAGMVAGGLGTAALYGSGAYLAHKKAKELEVKKKQDK